MSPFSSSPLMDTQGRQPASWAACYPNWSHSQERCYLISLLKKRFLHEFRERRDQGGKTRRTWRLVLFSLEETTAWFPSKNSPVQALWSAHGTGARVPMRCCAEPLSALSSGCLQKSGSLNHMADPHLQKPSLPILLEKQQLCGSKIYE